MIHGSLFSGIGGFDYAAQQMGWENVFHCEWNPFGQRVLKYYWPKAISYNDITKTDFTIHRGRIDVLTGGFPCQPYSTAGKRLGKEDERHLWPEMLRAIREIEPTWVVGENVRGLVNWNGGLVFDEVQADLEACGYEVLPFLLPACGVNAPHRRDRIWFVAHATNKRQQRKREQPIRSDEGKFKWNGGKNAIKNPVSDGRLRGEPEQEGTEDGQLRDISSGNSDRICREQVAGVASYTERKRLEGGRWKWGGFEQNGWNWNWEQFPTQSPVCTGDDGLSSRLDGITFSKWRNESIKAAGNAVVWQIPYLIFQSIQQTHDH